ncbi:unnamed protein product [Nezara viridula]|uniref:Annexin n=1 Tax=Nezara viridula TaxID=85310 RepID=A0A9P0HKC3_NEZVI|nr:unnamed protein product [Nezara viridula]
MSYPGYPTYPQAPGQHPPPQPNAPAYQTAPLSYPIYPGSAAPQPYGFPSPSPYQPYPQHSSPYPSANPAPGGYPQHTTPYPGSSMPTGSPYPSSNPTTGAYPPMSSHYPPTSSPYPSGNPPTSSPYPQSSPYPSGNSSPYQASPYPSGSAPAPYQQQQTSSHHASAAQVSSYPGSHGGQTSYPGVGRAEPAPLYAQVPPLTSHSSAKTPTPTVRPANPFNPRADAEILRKAMKGFGTDEKAIIEVLTNRTNSQRQQISLEFKTLYGKDLVSDLKSEVSGKLEDLLVALMTPIPDLLAKELNHAISGLGTKEETIVEILCTANNYEMKCIKAAYEKLFGSSLEQDLYGDTSGNFKRLLISLCQANRNEAFGVDQNLAFQDAQALMRAGELRLGTDESTFNAILCSRSYSQLAATFAEYQRLTGNDFESAIRSEFSGDIESGLIAIVHSVRDKSDFFADQLQKSMAGMGTHDRALIRIVCYRSEIDMGDIKNAYQRKFGKSLQEAIAGDTSGDYKKCLLSLIA